MKVEAKWEYPNINPSEKSLNHLMVKLEAPPDPQTKEKVPSIVVLALDKSWSMKGEKLEAVIEAACNFTNWLTRHDYLGIVAYAEDVQTFQQITRLTEKQSIVNRIRTIKAGTSTNLSGGWLQALRMIEEMDLPVASKHVILLTDGNPTSGIRDPMQLKKIAEQYKAKGIYTTTMGFGQDFNEELMEEIAEAGGGNFYFIDSPEKASDVFYEEFGNISALYAQAAELTIEIPDGYEFHELISAGELNTNENKLFMNMGDVRADETKTAIFSFEIDPTEKELKPLQISLRYFKVGEELQEQSENIKCLPNLGGDYQEIDKNVQVELMIAWAGKTIMQASKMAESDIQGAIGLLENMQKRLQENMSLAPDILKPLSQRITMLQSKLKEDAMDARKYLVAEGSGMKRRHIIPIIDDGVEYHDEIYEFTPKGELDLYNAPELKQKVAAKMKEGYRYIILDLSNVSYIDSSATGTLIQIAIWLEKRGGQLVVTNLTSALEKLFDLTKLNTFLTIAESISHAKAMLESRKSDS
ncbi:MAG: VWA domain-containing protein [Candidatus Hydrogenedentota bacterium]|nr:MAG: VWA domain-containing protein [Candidatus Hydrogenedentota bacterium]